MARRTARKTPAGKSKRAAVRSALAPHQLRGQPPAAASNDQKPLSPLAPATLAKLPPLAGVRLATGEANIRYHGRNDLLVGVLAPGTQVAGVFTQSRTASAPVEWCRENLPGGSARMLVVNSGNANAFTGSAGMDAVRKIAESAAAM